MHETIKSISVNAEKIEKLSLFLSKLINEWKEQDNARFVEGVHLFESRESEIPTMYLEVVYMDHYFVSVFEELLKNIDKNI